MSCPHGNHPDACDICDEVAAAYNSGVEHTKREWVGLTDDEATAVYAETEGKVNEHWNNGGTAMMFPPALYKAIEAKLKEKNT
jgi:hypothetical protein